MSLNESRLSGSRGAKTKVRNNSPFGSGGQNFKKRIPPGGEDHKTPSQITNSLSLGGSSGFSLNIP